MKLAICALSFLMAGMSVGAAESAAPPIEPAKEKAAGDLDARITSLQSTKDCISNAKTRDGVATCRTNVKIRTREIKKTESK